MKKVLLILMLAATIVSCKNDAKTAEDSVADIESNTTLPDGTVLLRGEYILSGDAAVLTTREEIYGIVLDDAQKQLEEKAAAFKKEQYDMVAVVIKGKVVPGKNPDGWKNFVEIKEIMHVEAARNDNTTVIQANPATTAEAKQ